jgi:uncharacterized SAM-binding protein YcdF (DUF218 family)
MFEIKKLISQFLMPVPLVTLLFLAGWVLARFSQYRRAGRVLQGLALLLFVAFGYGVGTERYLYRLERRYPSVELEDAGFERLRGAVIVVLGQGFAENSDLALRYRTGAVFQSRLQEGMRLFRRIPEAQMIVSVAGEEKQAPKEAFLDDYAREHGLARDRIHLIATARDTTEEARLALDVRITNTVVIVTSASHIPRAVTIFKKALRGRDRECRVMPADVTAVEGPSAGRVINLIPAPCDYQMAGKPPVRFRIWNIPLPSVDGFDKSQRMVYEWLGNVFEGDGE